ncbi:MAG: thioredoxin family protein, partial [Halobacteriota archaeon]
MKKQIGLLALSTVLIACVAFSGVAVASAQTSNIQVLFFESPMCGVCAAVKPLMEQAAAQTGVQVTYYDVSTSPGAGIAQANGVTETPTIVIQGGQTLTGSVTEAQIVAAIQAAQGSSTPKV